MQAPRWERYPSFRHAWFILDIDFFLFSELPSQLLRLLHHVIRYQCLFGDVQTHHPASSFRSLAVQLVLVLLYLNFLDNWKCWKVHWSCITRRRTTFLLRHLWLLFYKGSLPPHALRLWHYCHRINNFHWRFNFYFFSSLVGCRLYLFHVRHYIIGVTDILLIVSSLLLIMAFTNMLIQFNFGVIGRELCEVKLCTPRCASSTALLLTLE